MGAQPSAEPKLKELVEGFDLDGPLVGIVMGSQSDEEVMQGAVDELTERGISHEVNVLSAHRNPEGVRKYALSAEVRGLKVIIAGAGKAAALPGVIAAYTEVPVIGVPIRTSDLGGLDSLLSIVQMPSGVPVACVAINGARNAAILAARILRTCWLTASPGELVTEVLVDLEETGHPEEGETAGDIEQQIRDDDAAPPDLEEGQDNGPGGLNRGRGDGGISGR